MTTILSKLLSSFMITYIILLSVHICYAQSDEASFLRSGVEQAEHDTLSNLARRMKPRSLRLGEGGSASPAEPHQFFHLHHMKSGGTSLDSWINCGVRRLRSIHLEGSNERPYIATSSLSECSPGSYGRCIEDEKSMCRSRIENAATMTYCSPLAVVKYFNWTEADAVTMMRHPVDRVWSMFKFQTRSCFKCTDLKEIYADMDSGNTIKYGKGVCLPQLSNHISRNLLKNLDVRNLDNSTMTDEEKVADAIDSIKNQFTVVGLLSRLNETIDMMSHSFPWLQVEIEESDMKCPFPHSNKTPRNNGCGKMHPEESTSKGHWELPSEPDEETRRLIEEHNKLDMLVYEAALQQFELQKLAMVMSDEEDTE